MAMASEGFTGTRSPGNRSHVDDALVRRRTRLVFSGIAVVAVLVALLGVLSIGYAPLLGADVIGLISEY